METSDEPFSASALAQSQCCSDNQGLIEALHQAFENRSDSSHGQDDPTRHVLSARAIGRVQIVEVAGQPISLSADGCRDPAQTSAFLQLRGRGAVHQGDRTATLAAGDLCLMRASRPLRFQQDDSFEAILVNVPEAELASRFPLWRAALIRVIDGSSGVPAVFCDAVSSLKLWGGTLGDSGNEGLADSVMGLMGALICCAVPVNSDCIRRSFHHQERIKTFARLNLSNPDLSVELIAEAVGLSPRQIHRLFASEEMSLMRWVWVQRLEQCYRELMQNGSGQRTISQIAYAWGFNDQAHFSRTFRKHFGVSPGSLRRRSDQTSASLS